MKASQRCKAMKTVSQGQAWEAYEQAKKKAKEAYQEATKLLRKAYEED